MLKPLQRLFAAISLVVLIAAVSLFFSTGETAEGQASVLDIPTEARELVVRSTWEGDVLSGTEQPVFSFEVEAGGAPFTLRYASFKASTTGYNLEELSNTDHWSVYLVDLKNKIDYSKKVGEGIDADFNELGMGIVRLKFFDDPSSGLSSSDVLHLVVVTKPIRLGNEEAIFKMQPSGEAWAWAPGADLGAWTLLENKFGVDSISFL
ncbi:MAG: hypothetical protein AAB802_05270 [Patescibacteria group bacterium]